MSAISFARKPTRGLVSIVVPTYCKQHYIRETLSTVSSQTFKNWELIVVEDGTRTGSEQIVKEFARQHRWHRVEYSCSDRHYGVSHTRNVAFTKARGEYVALLDSDDRWFPDHLEASIKALEQSGKDVTYSTVVMIEDQNDHILGTWGPDTYELRDFPHSLLRRNFITPSATVLRRQVLADIGLWNTELQLCEDMEFWLRCISAGKSFQYTGGCHCLYRKNHDGAATQRLCATLEKFAEIVEQSIGLPGLRKDTCRRFASKAYLQAARFHQVGNSQVDPSADRFQVAPLLFKTWRLRPKRIEYLLEAIWQSCINQFRRRHMPTAPTAAAGNVEMPNRAAA